MQDRTKKIILIITLVLVIGVAGFFMGRFFANKNTSKPDTLASTETSQTSTTSPTISSTTPTKTTTTITTPAITSTTTTSSSVVGDAGEYGGWNQYESKVNNFTIHYPTDATLSDAMDGSAVTENTKCVKIENKYYHVIISSPYDENAEGYCLSMGYGSEWTNAPKDEVIIGGEVYQASGMLSEAASAGYYKDSYMAELKDKNQVEYGIEVNEKYDSAMTKVHAKEIVDQILQSYLKK